MNCRDRKIHWVDQQDGDAIGCADREKQTRPVRDQSVTFPRHASLRGLEYYV